MLDSIHLSSLLGFVLGLRHALDADHIVAVSAMVSETKSIKKSSILGVLWGVGHTTTLLLAGFLVIAFKLAIPSKVALSFEFLVGVVLVFLGLDVLWKLSKEKIHVHGHMHDGVVHTHAHSHKQTRHHTHAHRSFVVGMVHGLAGSAALMLLIVATARTTLQGLAYILVFSAGSIFGMLLVSALLGIPFVLTTKFDRIHNGVRAVAGAISVAFGLTLMQGILYAVGVA